MQNIKTYLNETNYENVNVNTLLTDLVTTCIYSYNLHIKFNCTIIYILFYRYDCS